jgi:hypothetical protein
MKRHILRTTVILTLSVMFCLGMSGGLFTAAASTQVNVNINIGTPPPVVVRSAPTMVYLPEPAAYVAVGVPYDIFFISGRYYYLHGDNWFWAGGYGGPWTYVSYKSLPPGLQKYRVERLREYREREYRTYQVQGPRFKGKHFEADEHGKGHDDGDHGNSDHDKNDHGRKGR